MGDLALQLRCLRQAVFGSNVLGPKGLHCLIDWIFLPTYFVESPIFLETMKWTYFVAAIVWLFNKLIPYSSWICTIGFTAVIGLYFENIYFSDNQQIRILTRSISRLLAYGTR